LIERAFIGIGGLSMKMEARAWNAEEGSRFNKVGTNFSIAITTQHVTLHTLGD